MKLIFDISKKKIFGNFYFGEGEGCSFAAKDVFLDNALKVVVGNRI